MTSEKNTILICYDLNAAGQDYEALIDAIKDQGTWWHHLDSTWIVKSPKSAKEMRDSLKPHIDSNDELLVVDITGVGSAWSGFNEKGSSWLKKNL